MEYIIKKKKKDTWEKHTKGWENKLDTQGLLPKDTPNTPYDEFNSL